jgi:hypothetical protein
MPRIIDVIATAATGARTNWTTTATSVATSNPSFAAATISSTTA